MNSCQPEEASLTALETALGHAKAYESWRSFDPGADTEIGERYAALPVLTKADIRAAYPSGLVPRAEEPGGPDLAAALRERRVEWVATSGTTDEQVVNLWNQAWWDSSERSSWHLNSVKARVATGDHREALLAPSASIGPRSRGAPLSFEDRRLGRFLYLNEFASLAEWPEGHCERMARELGEWQPSIIEGNPSFLTAFARYCARRELPVYVPELITLTYELPLANHLKAIRSVFPCPIASSYGSTEAGYVFMECEYGCLHQNADFCRVDFVPFREDRGESGVGVILVTSFRNEWTQLLRFDIGDVVRLAPRPCPCGRNTGLTLEAIEGRTKSITLASSGRVVTARDVDRALSVLAGVVGYRLIQRDDGSLELSLVPEGGARANADDAADSIRSLYGGSVPLKVSIENGLDPEKSGKFLYVKRETPVNWSAIV
jgi:phenylacetate-coenzyme A ligase PaaK-like adenylate-forming protein